MLKYQQIKLSYIIPVYLDDSLEPLHSLIKTYESYNEAILRCIHFIFVDDCSPIEIVIPQDCKLNYTLAKITTNIMWNQGGARNLGVHIAKSQKLIATDLDHTFPESVFEHVLKSKIPDNIFTFKRLRDGEVAMPHYNTFFLSKSTFFKSLGVDEEFCGNYGFEDMFFIALQKRLGTKVYTYRNQTVISHEHKNSKKPQHSLVRNEVITKPLYKAKIRILNDSSRDPYDAHSRLFLNFEWTIIKEFITI
jgi:hypothetical protein